MTLKIKNEKRRKVKFFDKILKKEKNIQVYLSKKLSYKKKPFKYRNKFSLWTWSGSPFKKIIFIGYFTS